MWLFRRVPLSSLAVMCRSLATLLDSGLPIRKSLGLAARQGGGRARYVLERVDVSVQSGEDLSSAFRALEGRVPDLFIDLVEVGEHSGTLPEVLKALSRHYERLVALRRTFISSLMLPAFQLVGAVCIVALLIYVLGMIGSSTGQPIDMLGWGLMGGRGATIWLTGVGVVLASVCGAYLLLAHTFRQKRALDNVLMWIPVVGHCLRSFAIARFSWSFAMLQEAGLPIHRSVEASLKATNNGAFIGAISQISLDLQHGHEISQSLRDSHLFPETYLQMVEVGENSGLLPETLERLSPQFEDDARRSLAAMSQVISWLVWLLVAGLIIFVIFSVMLTYIGKINENLQ